VSSLRLLEVAAQAELLRLKQEGKRMARMSALMAVAGLFALFALALLHIAALVWLSRHTGPVAAALWVMLADLVLAGVLVFISRMKPDPIALEAQRIRRRAIQELSAGSAFGDVMRLARRNHPAHEIGGMLAESLVRVIARR
jgi:hypothetical protein